MTLKVKQIHKHFVGEASGVDLSQRPDADLVEQINRAMDKYAVLVFRDQPLTQTEQIELAKSFGPLDIGMKRMKKQPDRMEHAELADISNVSDDGDPVERSHRKLVSNIANQLWHSDSSFQQPAARYSMLAAVRVPEHGGDTEFCDLRAAYDALDARTKEQIEGLVAEHYALHSRFLLGDTEYTDEQKAAFPPVKWPLVRTHAGSGRKVLFAGIHARSIEGMTIPEGRMLLMDMLEHATQPEFVYAHKWRPNDLVIWDNRCTLHRGRRFDVNEARELRRATTLDHDAPELQMAG